MKFPVCPIYMKYDISLTVLIDNIPSPTLFSTNPVEDRAKCHTHPPLQGWWKMVNEISDYMSIGWMENFIFHPVKDVR